MKRLPELYRRMDTTRLEEHLASAIFAGDANGRIQRLAWLAAREKAPRRQRGGVALAGEAEIPPANYLVAPETFTGAQRWLEQKVVMPTYLSAQDIALEWPVGVRMQAFFSAKVSSATVLQNFQEQVDLIASGKIGYGEARKRMTEFLAREGYGIPEPGTAEDRAIKDIASTARMELVLRQNVNMALAVGQRAVSEHPYVVEFFPNYRYIANTDRHEAFDGLVLPKTDPFWETHYPPWEFNCQCMAIDEDAEPNGRSTGWEDTPEGGQSGRLDYGGTAHDVEPAESGFVFRSDPAEAFTTPDPEAIENPKLRSVFAKLLRDKRETLEKQG